MGSIRDAAAEFSDVHLGDERLDKRLHAIVARAVISPAASFPKMMPTVAEREALYRFVENNRVEWSTVIEPHYQATAERARAAPIVRVAHDTSWMMFAGNRDELGSVLKSKKRGFGGHFSLVVSADDRRAPLGVVALSTFVRPDSPLATTKAARAAKHRASRIKAPEKKESARWMQNVLAAEARVGTTSCIHVMDQEADNYVIFADLVDAHCRFVVRGSGERSLKSRGETKHVDDVLDGIKARVFRTVPLNARKKQRGVGNPVRSERSATLLIRGASVVIERPLGAQSAIRHVGLNVVHVFEPKPPNTLEPIEWLLYTTEPIATKADLTAVVDHYRARWRIEEYFKALKTGCAFEKRQLTTYAALLRALALLAPIAWHLLAICNTARDSGNASASTLVDKVGLDVLRTLSPTSKFSQHPTAHEVMRSIADIGGHIQQNGSPGWMVLGRGFEDFVKADMIWRAALALGREK